MAHSSPASSCGSLPDGTAARQVLARGEADARVRAGVNLTGVTDLQVRIDGGDAIAVDVADATQSPLESLMVLPYEEARMGRFAVAFFAALMGGPGCSCGDDDVHQSPAPDGGPQVVERELEVATAFRSPVVDGNCDDYSGLPIMPLGLGDRSAIAGAYLLHTRKHAYLCIEGLGLQAGGSVAVRVSLADPREVALGDNEIELTIDPLSSTVAAARPAPSRADATVPLRDGDAMVTTAGGDLELRLDAGLLGGHGRNAGLWLGAMDATRTLVAQWPLAANADEPATWGDIALLPLYGPDTEAGSVYLDGTGHLVLPFLPELATATELTVEAWIQVIDDDCGTLFGAGRQESLWLGVCDTLAFGHGGESTIRAGQTRLGDDWHHVAVSIDAEGKRVLYVDGEPDLVLGQYWYPEEREEHEPERPVLPRQMPWIGADPDVGEPLHANVRDVRIWNVARTPLEIMENAFTQPNGPGLIAHWPLAGDLRDRVGGHHAGLAGVLAPSTARPTRAAFPVQPPPLTNVERAPRELPEQWDGRLPIVPEVAPVIDGVCRPDEYVGAARVLLEPNRDHTVYLQTQGEGMAVCVPTLLGGLDEEDGVDVYLHSDGSQRGGAPWTVRLLATPDGAVTPFTMSPLGNQWVESPAFIESRTLRDDVFRPQEDIRRIDTPYWTAEFLVPAELMGELSEGSTLDVAVEARTSVRDPAGGEPTRSSASLPAGFDDTVTSGWFSASVAQPGVATSVEIGSPADMLERHCREPDDPAPPPRNPPTWEDFDGACDCDPASYTYNMDCKWPPVDPDRRFVWAEGTFASVNVSTEDAPLIHTSHDVDMGLSVTGPLRYLNIVESSTEFQDTAVNQVIEWEQGSLPPNSTWPLLSVRPSTPYGPYPGDHSSMVGEWIFDCGHDPKTELHPLIYIETDREETRRTGWNTGIKVRTIHVWMNNDAGSGYVPRSMTSPFSFVVPLPAGTGQPFLRVWADPEDLDESEGVSAELLCDDTVKVTIEPPETNGFFYWNLYAGRLEHGGPAPSAYRIWFDELYMIDDQDDGDEDDAGEWYLDINVTGTWHNLLWFESISSGSHHSLENHYFDILARQKFYMHIISWDQDDDWDPGNPAERIELGPAMFPGPTSDSVMDAGEDTIQGLDAWELSYHWEYLGVDGLENMPSHGNTFAVMPEGDEPLAANEPDSSSTTPVQGIEVTDEDQTISRPGWITQMGARASRPDYFFFDRDVDYMRLAVDDFADVTVEMDREPELELTTTPRSTPFPGGANSECPYVPPSLFDTLGAKQYWVRVEGDPDAPSAFGPYDLDVTVRRRDVPPDDGEQDDLNAGGRPHSLESDEALLSYEWLDIGKCGVSVEPWDPSGREIPSNVRQVRSLDSGWMWQHEPGDVDTYTVTFGRPKSSSEPDSPVCFQDEPTLVLRAPGMQLLVPSLTGDVPVDGVTVPLDEFFAADDSETGSLEVQVVSRPGVTERCAYRLEAQWSDSVFVHYGDPGCPFASEIEAAAVVYECNELIAVSELPAFWFEDGPGLGDPAPFERGVRLDAGDGWAMVHAAEAGELDAVVSSPPGEGIAVELFDSRGVVVARGVQVDEELQGAERASGLAPSLRLSSDGLAAGDYLLHVRAEGRADEQGAEIRLGIEASP
ncbi:MAG: LamG domain-containing protein [Deltaproteobacteria bacterium]|nr:LamG domain-containing protein [Deltaproteobacteria bacterium]